MSDPLIDSYTLAEVQRESERALGKHGPGKVCTNVTMPRGEKLACLVEEVGEVAKALTYDNGDRRKLRAELVQVANVALAWAQAERELGELADD